MVVTKKLTVDLARKTILGTVDAVRGDSAIALELTLFSDGEPWVVPANASVIMRYCQGKAGGEYDTLPDGTAAWKASGNVLTVRVAPEVCSASGKTDFQVTIFKGADQISTFRMVVEVEGEVSGIDKPGAYTNLAQWLRNNGAEGQVMVSLEMEDLRTATDGTVYQSAGDAVRSQFSKLQTEKADKTDFAALQNRVEEVANTPCACEEQVMDLTGLIVDNYFTSDTGAANYQKGERCTDFVPVMGGYQLTLKNLFLRGNRALCVYDENKKFLRCLKIGTDDTELTLRLPLEAFYLRTSIDPKKTPDFRYIDLLEHHLQVLDDRLNNRITALDNRITREIEGISSLAGNIDLTDKIVNNHFLADNGKALTDNGERCTDFVPASGGYQITLENVNIRGNRSVCVYDENKKFLQCLKTGTEETTFTLTMPENTAYLRTSIDATVMPIIYYADIVGSLQQMLNNRLNNRATALDNRITREIGGISSLAGNIDLTDKIVNNHFLADNGKALTDNGECCTDFVPVRGGYQITLKNLFLRGNRALCVYDENKKFLQCLKTGTEETTFTLTMPENTAYLRTSIDATVMPIIYYADIVDSALAVLEKQIDHKGYQTESQVQTLIDNAIGRLPVYNGEVEDV